MAPKYTTADIYYLESDTSQSIAHLLTKDWEQQHHNMKRTSNVTKIRSCHAHCPAPFQATAIMLLPGEVTATAWLLAAYLWRRLRQTVLLPGKCTVWRAHTGLEHCLAEMTSQLGSQTVAVTSPAKRMAAVAWKARRVGVAIGYANIQSK